MKKLFNLFTILVVAAALFTGCKNDADKPSDKPSDECTIVVEDPTSIELLDDEWIFKNVNYLQDGVTIVDIFDATVADHAWTFTTGTEKVLLELDKFWTEDKLAQFDSLTEEEQVTMVKNDQQFEQRFYQSGKKYETTVDGHMATITETMVPEQANSWYKNMFIFSPEEICKTNATNTKYVVIVNDKITRYYTKKNDTGGAFDDCTTTITEQSKIVFSNGKWTHTKIESSELSYRRIVVALTISNGSFTPTAATTTIIFNVEEMLFTPEELEEFYYYSPDKKQTTIIEYFNKTFTSDVQLTSDDSITISGQNVIIIHECSSSEYEQEGSDIATGLEYYMFKDADSIKTNSTKTKYIFDHTSSYTMFYFSKN